MAAAAAAVKKWNPMMCNETEVITSRRTEADFEVRFEQFFRLQDQRWEESSARLQRMEGVLRKCVISRAASPCSARPARSPGDSCPMEPSQNFGNEIASGCVRAEALASSPPPTSEALLAPLGAEPLEKSEAQTVASLELGGGGAEGFCGSPQADVPDEGVDMLATSQVALRKLQKSAMAKRIEVQSSKKNVMASDLAMAKHWQKTEPFAPTEPVQDDLPWYFQERASVMVLVRNPIFDVCVASLILGNTVIIGLEVDREVRGLSPHPVLENTAVVFAILFGLELLIRILGQRLMFLVHPQDLGWNWFDLLVVGFSFADPVIQQAHESASDVSFLRLLRVVRCVRVIRVFRLGRFFRELRLMLFLIFCSFRSLIWVFVLLSMVIYIFAVIFTMGAAEEMYHDDHDNESDEELVLYYGSLPDSMLTLLKAAFGGADWGDLLEPLWHCSWIYVLTFFIFEAFMLLAVLNIVTGVFVQNTMDSAKKDLDLVIQDEMETKDSVISELRSLFREVEREQGDDDDRKTGEISEKAFEELLGQDRMKAYFEAVGIEVSEAKGFFRLLDTDSSGFVNAEEFAIGCLRLRGEAKTVDVVTLMYENKRMIQTITSVISEMHMEYHSIMAEVYTAERDCQASLREIRKLEQHPSSIKIDASFKS